MKWFAIALLVFCGTARAEPLAEFEGIVQQCRVAYQTRPTLEVVYVESIKLWVKRLWAEPKFSYDVRKTDSLVTPLTAFIEITDVVASDRAPDEAAARALAVSSDKAAMFVKRVNFSYQDKRWQAVGGKSTSMYRRDAGGAFAPGGYIDLSLSRFADAISILTRASGDKKAGDPTGASDKYAGDVAIERISGKPYGEPVNAWVLKRGHELEAMARHPDADQDEDTPEAALTRANGKADT